MDFLEHMLTVFVLFTPLYPLMYIAFMHLSDMVAAVLANPQERDNDI